MELQTDSLLIFLHSYVSQPTAASSTAPPAQSPRLAAILSELGHGPPQPRREGGRGGGDQSEGAAGRGGGVTLQVWSSPAAQPGRS